MEHPLHVELVGQFTVVVAPGLHGERRGNAAAQGESIEKVFGLSSVAQLEHHRGASHGLGIVVVRCKKVHTWSAEQGVHHLALHRARAVADEQRDRAEAALRIEGQRWFALISEEEIVGQLHARNRSCRLSLRQVKAINRQGEGALGSAFLAHPIRESVG